MIIILDSTWSLYFWLPNSSSGIFLNSYSFYIRNLISVTFQCCAQTKLQNWFGFINAKFTDDDIYLCVCVWLFVSRSERVWLFFFLLSSSWFFCVLCLLPHMHTGLFINGATSRILPKKKNGKSNSNVLCDSHQHIDWFSTQLHNAHEPFDVEKILKRNRWKDWKKNVNFSL